MKPLLFVGFYEFIAVAMTLFLITVHCDKKPLPDKTDLVVTTFLGQLWPLIIVCKLFAVWL
jgi:hypothetical protein